MGHGTKNIDEHDHHPQELSSLLRVPIMEEATTAQKSHGRTRCVAVLLLLVVVVSATAVVVAAARTGVPPLGSAFLAFVGTTGQAGTQGDQCLCNGCAACAEGFSCFITFGDEQNYCVPNGKENACCGYDGDAASEIDCLDGLFCDERTTIDASGQRIETDFEPTCHHGGYNADSGFQQFATKGSCNVNTGEPANILIIFKCDHWTAKCE